jgi:hypothetical protein
MVKKANVPAKAKAQAPLPARPRGQSSRPKHVAPADGLAAVKEYFKALSASQREIAERFDALVADLVPGVGRTIKWRIPFYGVPGNGWFVSCMSRPPGVRITFFQGTLLKPTLPVGGNQTRGVDLLQVKDVDASNVSSWIRQAAKLPGYAS